ncbi:MAG: ATP-binding protein [Deltaproteobacteria bacterium]|nr:ATP-binding protein [Deltaproteobacteria bacterium]
MKEKIRYVEPVITSDLARKMVFLAGPRQSGKTTIAKKLLKDFRQDIETRYLNWDAAEDREKILKDRFPAGEGMLVLDEIHKYSRWRQTVKGLYDKRGDHLQIMVTGSARLDHYRHGGDALQGRYHFHRLHPLSFAEIGGTALSDLEDLLAFSGFPEPFFLASEKETKRWSREYRTRLVTEDLQDLEKVKDIALVQQLVLRLPDLVGSPLSINSLREDLQVAHQTVARWVQILENLYMLFRIYPFGSPLIRAVKKEAKHYHLDWTVVKDPGARFENLVACHLLKWCHFLQDTEGRDLELRYFRDIDRREVNFVIMEDGKPLQFIECKTSRRNNPGRSLKYLKQRFAQAEALQIDLTGKDDILDKNNIHFLPAIKFLAQLV